MDAIKATVQGGRVDLVVPPDWPDGTQVIVRPVGHDADAGLREEDWSDSPDAVDDWLKWYDSLEPLIFTAEERANWEAARQDQAQFEKVAFAVGADRLRFRPLC